ncbi:PAS domain-containing sensor histidine kinase [Rhodanobacter sp. MP7CTX1]|uniref:hybrid sensor histidine kinase/response regulator n=1 Tax=Rhodanobacter sp. MP7CTX1 TaxID=2723084 RepID=UPI001609D775|nr:PAS domain-containing sensor histidine kinase [Rhodanobacter sp. MP7CTX1]MBB6189337.1 PAS domain S-box-containing protein [Rhodanobacter sp. MP7CTX1]
MNRPSEFSSIEHSQLIELQDRLREAEETLDAIRNGEVDALVVGGPSGQQVYTLENADRPYRVLIEQMQEGAVTLSEDGVMLYCNQRFAALVGADRQTLIGESIERFLAGEEIFAFRRLMTLDRGFGRSAELSLLASNGLVVPVNMSIADLEVDEQMPKVLCGVITDLTRSRERSHELAAANLRLAREIDERRRVEDSLQLALDAAEMGHWDLDLLNNTLTRSTRHDQIFGQVNGVKGWGLLTMLSQFVPDDRNAVNEEFLRAESSGSVEFERRIHRLNDGAVRWVQVKGRTFYLNDKAIRISGVVSDVTERRQVEEQLRQSQKMEAIGKLTGGIAHDFNNLLMVIGGSLDMLDQRVAKNEKITRYLTAARHGVERGATLNQQLLAFSRRQDLRAETICIDDLINTFANLLDRAVGEAVTVKIEAAPELWYCRTDAHQLETAILNLAINARDAMPQGGTLTLKTTIRMLDVQAATANGASAGDYVAVSVADTGVGMTPDVIERVFEPFFTTKEVGKGTGLGLSQVYGFARQSGGFVSIESCPGIGTTVSIHLPRATSLEATEVVADTPVEVRGKGIVLVVEDDSDVRAVASSLLEDLGYSVLEAETGSEAMKLMDRGERIDLVFTDVIMPGEMNGIDLVRAMKIKHAGIPVLLTSGYTAQRIAMAEMAEGLQLLRKPYTQVDLSLAVRSVMKDQA